MDADTENPSELRRFHVNKLTESRFVEWNKKRKLQSDEFGLPISKHNCLTRSFTYGSDSLAAKSPELASVHNHSSITKMDVILDDGSELESENSNSIMEESDSVISMSGEATQEADCPRTVLCGKTNNLANDRVKEPQHSLNGQLTEKESSSKKELVLIGEEHISYPHDSDLEALHNLEDHLLEFGSHPDNFSYEYEHHNSEHNVEKEFKDVMSLDGVNQNMFVLSSGRWSVNPESDSSRRKPTIDQEFEEYFSTLMI